MSEYTPQALDKELNDLWLRRRELSEREWHRLYSIVRSVLQSFPPRELAALPEDARTYIDLFFTDKVVRLQGARAGIHAGALRYFYRNYLIDQIRSVTRDATLHVSLDADAPSTAGISADEAGQAAEAGMGATAGYCSACGDDDRDAWLEGTGTTIESLDDRARAWLASQEEWVRDYLAFCFCPEGEARVPLVTLARSRALSSYHYKAERLGITWSSEKAVAAARSYGDTLLGRWMRDELGLDLSQENNPLLLVALKILCGQALLWREQQESGQ